MCDIYAGKVFVSEVLLAIDLSLVLQNSPVVFIADVLIENSRLSKTSGVIKAYMTIMSACRGEVSCVVTTAKVRECCLFTQGPSLVAIIF